MGAERHSFSSLAEGVGTGEPLPAEWARLSACDCLILVGLTGVGKSTTLTELRALRPAMSLLPDRRQLTDLLMIPFIQKANGLPLGAVNDRSERFSYTRQYRERFPGGMAHALSMLSVSPQFADGLVVFDGLRGENEARHAAATLPRAHFLMLDAPDAVRLRRLLTRQDAFDQLNATTGTAGSPAGSRQSLASHRRPELAEILTADEVDELAQWVALNGVSTEDVAAKARIILAERRNYNPAATREALISAAGKRALVLDTQHATPSKIAECAVEWLRR